MVVPVEKSENISVHDVGRGNDRVREVKMQWWWVFD